MIDSYFALISSTVSPKILAFKKTFSFPVKSGLKPLPNSSKAPIFPIEFTVPELGLSVPEINCKVLFPDPFKPIIPTESPFLTLKEILSKAKKVFLDVEFFSIEK